MNLKKVIREIFDPPQPWEHEILNRLITKAPSPSAEPFGRRKVFLVGSAESRAAVPWDDESADIWVLNLISFTKGTPRFDAWFEVHQSGFCVGPYRDFLRAIKRQPVYVLDEKFLADVPAAVLYPLQRMIDKYGARYFTNTPAYMLALAIDQGYEEIHLYGMAMRTGSEYAYERACMEWLLGYARAVGITIHIERPSSLLEAEKLYGAEEAYTGVNMNMSPEELVAMIGQKFVECSMGDDRLNKTREFLAGLEKDPNLEAPFDLYNQTVNVEPTHLLQMIGALTAKSAAINREMSVMLNHVAMIRGKAIQTIRPDLVAPSAAVTPAGPASNGKEPALAGV